MSQPTGEFCYPYPRPAVTVDVVLRRASDGAILLIQRRNDPFAGHWALPGGFVDEMEDLEPAARRELLEETGIEAGELQQLGAWGTPGRDPRGHTISVVYLGHTDAEEATPGDDAALAVFHRTEELPPLAFDHDDIIAAALKC